MLTDAGQPSDKNRQNTAASDGVTSHKASLLFTSMYIDNVHDTFSNRNRHLITCGRRKIDLQRSSLMGCFKYIHTYS